VEEGCWVGCGCTDGVEGGGIDDLDDDLLLRFEDLGSGRFRFGRRRAEEVEAFRDFGCFWSHLSAVRSLGFLLEEACDAMLIPRGRRLFLLFLGLFHFFLVFSGVLIFIRRRFFSGPIELSRVNPPCRSFRTTPWAPIQPSSCERCNYRSRDKRDRPNNIPPPRNAGSSLPPPDTIP
jgi:hypothetical protein